MEQIFSAEDMFRQAALAGAMFAEGSGPDAAGDTAASRAKKRAQIKKSRTEKKLAAEEAAAAEAEAAEEAEAEKRKEDRKKAAQYKQEKLEPVLETPIEAGFDVMHGLPHPNGRCKECKIQKKGRCGTMTASRKCLNLPPEVKHISCSCIYEAREICGGSSKCCNT